MSRLIFNVLISKMVLAEHVFLIKLHRIYVQINVLGALKYPIILISSRRYNKLAVYLADLL